MLKAVACRKPLIYLTGGYETPVAGLSQFERMTTLPGTDNDGACEPDMQNDSSRAQIARHQSSASRAQH